MKKQIILTSINILLLLIVCTSVVYGWYTNGLNTSKVTITNASLATKVTLYEAVDFNRDGNLDLPDGEDFNSKEYFKEVVTKTKEDEKYLKIEFNDLIPTEIYTWKVRVDNLGDANGYFAVHLSEYAEDYYDIAKYFSIKYAKIVDDTYSYSEKIYIGNAQIGDLIAGGYSSDNIRMGEDESFLIAFELVTYNELVSAGVLEKTDDTYEAYQNLQNISDEELYYFIDIVLSSEYEKS